jgi:hypothetical protein
VERLAGLGLTQEMIAARLGIGHTTFVSRLKDTPSFRQAFDIGLAAAVERAAGKLDDAIGAGDMESVRFFLKTRGKFRIVEPPVVVLAGGMGPPPTIDGHVIELSRRHSALLDSPDPDANAVDAEFNEVSEDTDEVDPSARQVDEPTAEELAAVLA